MNMIRESLNIGRANTISIGASEARGVHRQRGQRSSCRPFSSTFVRAELWRSRPKGSAFRDDERCRRHLSNHPSERQGRSEDVFQGVVRERSEHTRRKKRSVGRFNPTAWFARTGWSISYSPAAYTLSISHGVL